MGGVCLIFPTNFSRLASTSSRLTWRHGATRTRDPSQSYVSVSHPNKHVVLYSFHKFHCSYSKKKEKAKKQSTFCQSVRCYFFLLTLVQLRNSLSLLVPFPTPITKCKNVHRAQGESGRTTTTHPKHHQPKDPTCHPAQLSLFPSSGASGLSSYHATMTTARVSLHRRIAENE